MNAKQRSEKGIKLLQLSEEKKAFANSEYIKNLHNGTMKPFLINEAKALEADARALMNIGAIDVSPGGESLHRNHDEKTLSIKDTIHDPNQVTVAASADRMNLAYDANCLSMAVDAAESIQARNSLEKMLTHNLAACHDMAMKLIARMQNGCDDTVDIARLTNASTKLMNTYQNGLRTLNKLRNGGQQKMIVEHVHVHEGGQAIVGQVKPNKGGV
jgi:hypothetical protein